MTALQGKESNTEIKAPHASNLFRAVFLVSAALAENTRRELRAVSQKCDFAENQDAKEIYFLSLEQPMRVELFTEPRAAVEAVRRLPANLILIDNRELEPRSGFAGTMAGQALPELLAYSDPGRAPSRRSILVILPKSDSTAHQAYAVGALQLGGVLIDPLSAVEALDSAFRIVRPMKSGKVALCLAGGGIEGMIYEMGVLRALDAHLVGRSVADFDIFSGISAGSIISAFLANGVKPKELSDALLGNSSRLSPITRSMLFDPNLAEMASRAAGAAGDLLRGHWLRKPLDSALKVTPTALFSGDKMKWHLEKELNSPGMTNDFNQLKKELYVGVTDQDSGSHVTFGVEGLKDIPISHALRASAAMTPYYPPEKIKGRYYIDGIFTRAVNLDIAVARGASLVVCVDPLTPVQVDEPGYSRNRGGFFNTVQSVKALIRTRFSEMIGRAEEAYPNVAVCVFSPTRQDLEQMSLTMMRFVYRREVERMAFQSVSQRIQRDFEWLAADFERHGFELSRRPKL